MSLDTKEFPKELNKLFITRLMERDSIFLIIKGGFFKCQIFLIRLLK